MSETPVCATCRKPLDLNAPFWMVERDEPSEDGRPLWLAWWKGGAGGRPEWVTDVHAADHYCFEPAAQRNARHLRDDNGWIKCLDAPVPCSTTEHTWTVQAPTPDDPSYTAGEITDPEFSRLVPTTPDDSRDIVERLRPALYATWYPMMVEAARGCGYALALHGSLTRDMDVIAIPWTDEATDAPTLMEAVCDACGFIHDGQDKVHSHGRHVFTLLADAAAFIDFGVMPRLRALTDGERIEGCFSIREHVVGRLQAITITAEPSHDQCLRLNDAHRGNPCTLIIHTTGEDDGHQG